VTYSPGALPDQTSRTFVITGGNAGLGYFTAEQLASTGAHVVLAARNSERADAAVRSLRALVPGASVDTIPLDLTSLASVRAAGARLADYGRIDGLVLNAGITSGSRRRELTGDGFETTFQSNYLGHFALTALAWPALARTAGSRVVGLGSIATSLVRLAPDDLQTAGRYDFFRAYGLSKHAIHGFILELDRRARLAGAPVSAVLAHPGFALDGLSTFRPGVMEPTVVEKLRDRALFAGAQGKNRGAAPIVRALLDPEVVGGEFVGPEFLVKGRPVLQQPVASSASPEFGGLLWAMSEDWSGVEFNPLAG
jgi:NAD(P)-dependent dehydrogenase (short-subunit alcohol dehydrogenase family)